MRLDPWQGKMLRVIQITCGNCRRDDEWAVDPVTMAMARRYFHNQGWRKLRDDLWYCKGCVPSTEEHLRASRVVAMALSAKETTCPD